MSNEESLDLPLLSLESDYKVEHYLMKLTCELDKKTFSGEVYVFVKHCGPGSVLILDLKNLFIDKVEEIDSSDGEISNFLISFDKKKSYEQFGYWSSKNERKVIHPSYEDWCVKIETLEKKETLVCLHYRTKPEGSSVSWFLDDDGSSCCLTTGSLINNRSLVPSQDAPSLMATWQLLLQVPKDFSATTTGDDSGFVTDAGTYFFTSMLLPISTFALAIGKWKCSNIPMRVGCVLPDDRLVECRHPHYPCPFAQIDAAGLQIPSRVFYSDSFDPSILRDYIPSAIETIYRILGRHVVPKLDFIIVPQSVACLGFASPGLILISPSILFGQTPMLSRLGHEISHSWFGINIGPKNWNEEWISEGFATFMEVIFNKSIYTFYP
jgi:aminopeptidase O